MNTEQMKIASEFNLWTTTRKTKTGYTVKCKKGFWRVDALKKEDAEREAMHYFEQYYADGEYI